MMNMYIFGCRLIDLCGWVWYICCCRFPGQTCATCLVRSCTEVISQTTGIAGSVEPTWRSSCDQNRWVWLGGKKGW